MEIEDFKANSVSNYHNYFGNTLPQGNAKESVIHQIVIQNNLLLKDSADISDADIIKFVITDSNASLLGLSLLNHGAEGLFSYFMLEKYPEKAIDIFDHCNFNSLDKNGHSLFDMVKIFRMKKKSEMKAKLNNLNPELELRAKELKMIKSIGHCWDLAMKINLKNPNNCTVTQVSLEAGSSMCFAYQISKAMKTFYEEYNILDESQALPLINALQRAADHLSDKEILAMIHSGQPTIIFSGYSDHGTAFLLWNNNFVICDTSGVNEPLSFRDFDPSKLTEVHIREIKDSYFRQQTAYENFLNFLDSELNLKETVVDHVNRCDVQVIEKQTVGNCGWKCLEGLVFAYLVLEKLQSGDRSSDEKAVYSVFQSLTNVYYQWNAFLKTIQYEKYVNYHAEKVHDYPPSLELLEKIANEKFSTRKAVKMLYAPFQKRLEKAQNLYRTKIIPRYRISGRETQNTAPSQILSNTH